MSWWLPQLLRTCQRPIAATPHKKPLTVQQCSCSACMLHPNMLTPRIPGICNCAARPARQGAVHLLLCLAPSIQHLLRSPHPEWQTVGHTVPGCCLSARVVLKNHTQPQGVRHIQSSLLRHALLHPGYVYWPRQLQNTCTVRIQSPAAPAMPAMQATAATVSCAARLDAARCCGVAGLQQCHTSHQMLLPVCVSERERQPVVREGSKW